jgi:hypothetical protein
MTTIRFHAVTPSQVRIPVRALYKTIRLAEGLSIDQDLGIRCKGHIEVPSPGSLARLVAGGRTLRPTGTVTVRVFAAYPPLVSVRFRVPAGILSINPSV